MLKKVLFTVVYFNLLATSALATCGDSRSQFLAAVVEVDGNIEVWINTRKNWNERGALVDSYTAGEAKKVDRITDIVGLCNLAESQYEPCPGNRTVAQIKKDLKKTCVQVDSDFQTWAEKEIQ